MRGTALAALILVTACAGGGPPDDSASGGEDTDFVPAQVDTELPCIPGRELLCFCDFQEGRKVCAPSGYELGPCVCDQAQNGLSSSGDSSGDSSGSSGESSSTGGSGSSSTG